ncbi:eukaryotic translation initiation factor 1A, X-chromosomal-like [Choloepus didactylus]|uniref:eukaryotic translation initiation factor 1A, X-chromosomal-like n=1 Tax=Choloepus didactylus TaxID=27675 RepID=UPI00189C9BBB|nr:eukaryotic translation initiation factor 1A, X-chromosomal-like [Choloepus didactylus]
MPKNKGIGGKNRYRGKNENESEKRELVFKEDGQEYSQVIKMSGNGQLEAMCFDGVKSLCHIRGKLRKKFWINTSDIILVGLHEYQDNKADLILKYNADEAGSLKVYGELPEHAKINETDTFGPGDDDEIQFDDIGDNVEEIRSRCNPVCPVGGRKSQVNKIISIALGNSLFSEPTYSGSVIECDPQGTVKDHPEYPSDLLLDMAEIYHRRGR